MVKALGRAVVVGVRTFATDFIQAVAFFRAVIAKFFNEFTGIKAAATFTYSYRVPVRRKPILVC